MRITFLIFFSTFSCSIVWSQVVNSLSKDKTGFYGHALDSAISIIKQNKKLRTVYVTGKPCVKEYLPDTLQDISIRWKPLDHKKRKNDIKLKEDEMIVLISCLIIIRDEVIVNVITAREGDWAYEFQYYYQPETKDYRLKNVERGLRH